LDKENFANPKILKKMIKESFLKSIFLENEIRKYPFVKDLYESTII
jgi:hypothetical protein